LFAVGRFEAAVVQAQRPRAVGDFSRNLENATGLQFDVFRGFPDAVMFVLGGGVTVLLVTGLAWFGRRGWWWLVPSCLVAAAGSLVAALGVSAAIRA
jgi:hypothetical protein